MTAGRMFHRNRNIATHTALLRCVGGVTAVFVCCSAMFPYIQAQGALLVSFHAGWNGKWAFFWRKGFN